MSVMAGVTLDEIYQMRIENGLTWSEVAESLGLPADHSDWVSDNDPVEEEEGDEREEPPITAEEPPLILPDR
jgi:hypothetical protein